MSKDYLLANEFQYLEIQDKIISYVLIRDDILTTYQKNIGRIIVIMLNNTLEGQSLTENMQRNKL